MRFLLDEMFPAAAGLILREEFGHEAVHVAELGLSGAPDGEVAGAARGDGRALVTENIADFSLEPDLLLVCVLKRNLPSGGGQAHAVAVLLNGWAQANPRPYLGQHWPEA
ncbi:MAG: DUF5615 family PIN-like protein [Actinomycetota bacterium]